MNKSERIRELYKTGKYTTRQIADIVGCDVPYVRVAAKQRSNGAMSPIDARYLKKRYGTRSLKEATRKRYQERCLDPAFRERERERFNQRYHTDPEFRAKHLARCATYRALRKAEARAS